MNSAVETAMANTKADAIFDAVWPNTLGCRLELEWDEALQFLKRIDRYNNFEWEKVNKALDLIDKIIPTMEYGMLNGEPNKNNGKRNFTIEVGRERSPVIYIERYEWNHGFGKQPPLTEQQCKNVCALMEKRALADESTYEVEEETRLCHYRKITFRFWWD